MSYRVCIPCAGTGSRLGGMTQFINKSLVSVANRPTLSHIIEQFPDNAEFVIALGYKGDLVRQFLELAYPERQFYFVDVNPFEGPGSGLGLSLQACKQYLQQPFVFNSCDTMVEGRIPDPDSNWMGYAEVEDLASYRTIEIKPGRVSAIAEKGEGHDPDHRAYIGLAGIFDHELFWTAMSNFADETITRGEAQGLRSLLPVGIHAYKFRWYDTGNPESLNNTREHYRKPGEPNILEKPNEAIWFVGNNVIKYSDDKNFIINRSKRVWQLQGYVPEISAIKENMYCYKRVEGNPLSENITLPIFNNLLETCKKFWETEELTPEKIDTFEERCLKFYRDKTMERISLFYRRYRRNDGIENINGIEMIELSTLLESVDWKWLANGVPGRFHGDFHFENILWDADREKFTFLDWRQDFGGDLIIGDIYYDLAKLMHGLIINHELIVKKNFQIEWDDREINFDFLRKNKLVECETFFGEWLKSNGYDVKKVMIITSLIYLNIAALHHENYSLLLFALGKSMLRKLLEK
jgi:choline kinase